MKIEQIMLYVLIGIIGVATLTFIIVKIIQFSKMSKEDKIKLLKTYLKGLVALAEQEIVGTKKGEERLQMVEDYFNKKAPHIYKVILSMLGRENLKDLIEEALKEIKNSFGG